MSRINVENIRHPDAGADSVSLDLNGNVNIDSGTLYVDAGNDRVGIGTALPSTALHLKADSPYVTFEDDNDNQDWEIRPTSRFALYDVTNSEERLAVDSSGRLLVGTNSFVGTGNGTKLQVIGNDGSDTRVVSIGDLGIDQQLHLGSLSSGTHYLTWGGYYDGAWNSDDSGNTLCIGAINFESTTSGSQIAFRTTNGANTGPTDRITIDSSGNMYLNPGGTAGRFYLNTTSTNRSFGGSSTGSGSSTVYIGNAAIQVSSDERIKENIQDTQLDALAAVKQISVKDFTWNDPKDTSHNNRNARGTWTGVIAQELVEILPFVVNAPRNEDDLEIDYDSEEIWTLDQSQLCPVLIKAMQQQQAMIETLEAKVAALEAQ